MTIFIDYKCRTCGVVTETTSDQPPVIHCNSISKRLYNFYNKPGFVEHFNPSVDMWVDNKRILGDAMKVASDDMTNYSGIEHKFVPRDPMDHAAFGLSDADVESAREYQDRLVTDGSVVKGASPFKPEPKLIVPGQ